MKFDSKCVFPTKHFTVKVPKTMLPHDVIEMAQNFKTNSITNVYRTKKNVDTPTNFEAIDNHMN